MSRLQATIIDRNQKKKIVIDYDTRLVYKIALEFRLLGDLNLLYEDADYAGPWHGLSTYGEVRGGVHYGAVDICNEEDAQDLLKRAQKAYNTLEMFWKYITVS